MADDMTSIPPRVNSLEQGMHTIAHRVTVLEDTHKETPYRVQRLEIAVERLPQIEAKLTDQGDMIKRGFFLTHGILFGVSAAWMIYQAGPQIMMFLSVR